MTTVRLRYDDLWAEVDLDADPTTWARELVRCRWLDEETPPDDDLAERAVTGLAAVVGALRSQEPPPLMGLLLLPRINEPLVTVVAVRCEPVDEPVTLAEVAEVLRLPAEMLEIPAEEDVVDTAAGPALRLLQRFRTPVDPDVEQVQENLAYAWSLDDVEILDDEGDLACGPVVVTVSTSFEDLVDAGQWRATVDDLARSLTVTTGA
ncbi:MAG: hypothetical protein GXX79_22260 [Actinomycetales bacterium]|nr:hypothetical protein [Actinomycetales bacterium]